MLPCLPQSYMHSPASSDFSWHSKSSSITLIRVFVPFLVKHVALHGPHPLHSLLMHPCSQQTPKYGFFSQSQWYFMGIPPLGQTLLHALRSLVLPSHHFPPQEAIVFKGRARLCVPELPHGKLQLPHSCQSPHLQSTGVHCCLSFADLVASSSSQLASKICRAIVVTNNLILTASMT